MSASAWDVAGAVVWTPLACWWWYVMFTQHIDPQNRLMGLAVGVWLGLVSVYCIARLCGAHA